MCLKKASTVVKATRWVGRQIGMQVDGWNSDITRDSRGLCVVRGKFGSIDSAGGRPLQKTPLLCLDLLSLFRISRVVKLHAEQRVYTRACIFEIYVRAGVQSASPMEKGFYYSQSATRRRSVAPFRFIERTKGSRKALSKQICELRCLSNFLGVHSDSLIVWTSTESDLVEIIGESKGWRLSV